MNYKTKSTDQLDLFDNSDGFKPKSRGRIEFYKLSLHEKINLRGYYQFMPWNLPFHDGFFSHYSYYETNYNFYVKQGLTEKLDDYFFVAQKNHYTKLDENKRRNSR